MDLTRVVIIHSNLRKSWQLGIWGMCLEVKVWAKTWKYQAELCLDHQVERRWYQRVALHTQQKVKACARHWKKHSTQLTKGSHLQSSLCQKKKKMTLTQRRSMTKHCSLVQNTITIHPMRNMLRMEFQSELNLSRRLLICMKLSNSKTSMPQLEIRWCVTIKSPNFGTLTNI